MLLSPLEATAAIMAGLEQPSTSLARACDVPRTRIEKLAREETPVTADTDLRLARYFKMSEGFFIGLQTHYELMERKRQIGAQFEGNPAKSGVTALVSALTHSYILYIHLSAMAITYDPAKRDWTLRERGLDFERAAEVFAGPTIDIPDLRRDYGELRTNSIGYLSGRMVFICWTRRGDDRHVISMRKANAREQARYSKAIAAAYGERTEED